MGDGKEFYLCGKDESQMAKVFEYKAKSVLHSGGNREPLKILESDNVMIRAYKWFGKRRIWRCIEHSEVTVMGHLRDNAVCQEGSLKSSCFAQSRRENFLSF